MMYKYSLSILGCTIYLLIRAVLLHSVHDVQSFYSRLEHCLSTVYLFIRVVLLHSVHDVQSIYSRLEHCLSTVYYLILVVLVDRTS